MEPDHSDRGDPRGGQSLLGSLRRWVGSTTVIYECRHCGTTLDSPDRWCPCCDRHSVAVYRIE